MKENARPEVLTVAKFNKIISGCQHCPLVEIY
jgi:hypothetical protein